MSLDADAIVIGAGLAGLVAACEIADAGKRVIVLEQEPEQSLGGQAFWSLGGLFLVDSPEQRRLRIRDSYDLAMQDWLGSAGFDRGEDHWPRRWAEAYVGFAAGEKRSWLRAMGHRVFSDRRLGRARRRIGAGTRQFRAAISPDLGHRPRRASSLSCWRAREAERAGRLQFCFRHRVDELDTTNGAVDGVSGAVLEPSDIARGEASSRNIVGSSPSRRRR